ncbi:hypothetical protein N0V88_003362 [Collariella sp. IMI 366227]|nr:hypothetical protein N0V88_003362 [Collariella sp. IMI 366227]
MLLPGDINVELSTASVALILEAAAILSYVVSSVIACFSYSWLVWACGGGRMTHIFEVTSKKYGDGPSATIRIGPNELLTSNPDVIRRINGARSRYTRSTWYKLSTIDPYNDAMFNAMETSAHDRIKAQTAPGYAGKNVDNLEGEIDSILMQMVEVIQRKYAAKISDEDKAQKPWLDLAVLTQYFTLDSICWVAFGHEFGLVREEWDVYGQIEMLNEVSWILVVVAAVPYFRAIMGLKFVLPFMTPKPGDTKDFGRILPQAIVSGEQLSRIGSAPMPSTGKTCLAPSHNRHGHPHNTTFLYIMTTPSVYHRLLAEIDEGIAAGKISSPVRNAEALNLPYLQAVILKRLRLHAPLCGLMSKVVPSEGDTIDGKHVPGGTLITQNYWSVGHHPGLFGQDADLFRPKRWLGLEREEKAEMRRMVEMVFGYGRWGCAGKMIAFMELNKVFVELLRRFDFQLVNPTKPWKCVNYNLFVQSDMWVSVSMREDDVSK